MVRRNLRRGPLLSLELHIAAMLALKTHAFVVCSTKVILLLQLT